MLWPRAATLLVGGAGEWRVRTGDNRIIDEILDQRLIILVIDVGHRRGTNRTAASAGTGRVRLISTNTRDGHFQDAAIGEVS